MKQIYQLYFYCPITAKEKVKESVFAAGAGKIGNYSHCCFEYEGFGQFKPLLGSNPHLGKTNELEVVKEVKIELLCEENLIEAVTKALKQNHPYEEVAYGFIKIKI